ncbi:ABC transporter ATP-binding protein [Halostella sp. JP-L12]|uniref:ABC transporter ATP-binding protein n=1 Tax=Halostella TaxID=1843185 RepID=UPI000EF83A35|nr:MULTISPECIES: ABC transporter ATP-binding protein [Halostella]NHN49383.1 ABC transporter ATP-binding protein [Halostella sp. JP-L12]
MSETSRETTAQSAPLLTVDDVDYSFGAVSVLDGVSFEVPRRSITAVVGPNGSGKTTLAEIVAGLRRADSGEISLDARGERQVGYLPQTPRFRPAFSVEETLRFYADLLATPVDVGTVLDRVGLGDVRDRRVDALSGGMRRLLGLAQSFLGDPSLVILDEPTSGLDPRMTKQIFDVAAAQTDEGTAIFLTTHDLSYAADADRIVVLDNGSAVSYGTPAELLERTNTDSLSEAFLATVGPTPAVQTGTEEK